MSSNRKKLVLIDGYALVHRAFHAFSRANLTSPEGEPTGAVYGFAVMLLNILAKVKPDYIIATFDTAAPTFRHEEYAEYKATRVKAPDELYEQIPHVIKLAETFNIPIFAENGVEADDLIGTLARQAVKKDVDVYIATGDMDALQLVDDHTFVYGPGKSFADVIIYTPKIVKEKRGLTPEQVVDFKGLRGDASDNIPGVPGIGEVTAKKLLSEYKTLEDVLENADQISGRVGELLRKHKALALQSKRLATIVTDLPIKLNLPAAEAVAFDSNKVRQLFGELGFRSLVNKIPNGSLTESTQTSFFETAPKPRGKTSAAQTLDKKLDPILRRIEKAGILLNTKLLKELSTDVEKRTIGLRKKIIKKAGVGFNPNSPAQLADILFNVLKFPTLGIKKTTTGYSTAVGELEKLVDQSPIIKDILTYRKLEKLRGTYLEPLPKMIDKNGRIHTTYAQDTSTGRLSSKDPNLQNIPIRSELGAEIRKAFIAPKDFRLISADYSQIELRIVASLAKDVRMIEIFKRGEDIHASVAAAVNGVSSDKVTKEMRRNAKAINFGLIYGVSPWGLAANTGMSVPQATRYIERYFELHPQIKKYMEDIVKFCKQHGYVQTIFGRKRYFPDINSKSPGIRNAAARAAINMPIQGTAADIIKAAMIQLDAELPKVSPKSRVLLQVHDELVVETPTKDVKKVATLVKNVMENVFVLDVPIIAEVEAGSNWGETKPV
jgi:DNA polymerase I-like protein with 3'-5' exonuclease and polymerase domains/5'-3' exonuclease